MKVITPEFIQGKKVLLRLDLDVPLERSNIKDQKSKIRIADDFRLRVGLPTLEMCLTYAKNTIIMGHIGRPLGREVPELSVAPIVDWLEEALEGCQFDGEALHILENLRFESGEEKGDLSYAKELASLGEVFVNESFAAFHPAASTTVLPTLFPAVEDPEGHLCPRRAAGLRFAEEVRVLREIRENPQKPLVAIIGGAKIEDKLPVALALSKVASAVFLGGKLPAEIKEKNIQLPHNVLAGRLNTQGTDVTPETVQSWKNALLNAQTIIWNGPLGKIQSSNFKDQSLGSEQGTYDLAQIIINTKAKTIVGGGDTVGFLGKLGLLDKFGFVSSGGGAMLELLEKGTLPTIEALK